MKKITVKSCLPERKLVGVVTDEKYWTTTPAGNVIFHGPLNSGKSTFQSLHQILTTHPLARPVYEGDILEIEL